MTMIAIIGNHISALVAAAFCEVNHMKYQWFYTKEIEDLPFYFNDFTRGMLGRIISLLEIPTLESEKNEEFFIMTEEGRLRLGMTIEEFCGEMVTHYPEKKVEIGQYFETLKKIGEEWKKVVDMNFDANPSLSPLMSRNFMNSYEGTLKKQFNCSEIEKLFLSLVPKEDISLNTAAGYIVNQLFDGSYRDNCLHRYIEAFNKLISGRNKRKITDFNCLEIDTMNKKVVFEGCAVSYDLLIHSVETKYHTNRLMFFSLERIHVGNTFSPVFLAFDHLAELGVSQAVIWKKGPNYQLDIYYNHEKFPGDDKVESWIKDNVTEYKVTGKKTYEQLVEEFAITDFSGWAFSVKDILKNPLNYKGKKEINLAGWGTAFFTSSLLAIKCIKEESGDFLCKK